MPPLNDFETGTLTISAGLEECSVGSTANMDRHLNHAVDEGVEKRPTEKVIDLGEVISPTESRSSLPPCRSQRPTEVGRQDLEGHAGRCQETDAEGSPGVPCGHDDFGNAKTADQTPSSHFEILQPRKPPPVDARREMEHHGRMVSAKDDHLEYVPYTKRGCFEIEKVSSRSEEDGNSNQSSELEIYVELSDASSMQSQDVNSNTPKFLFENSRMCSEQDIDDGVKQRRLSDGGTPRSSPHDSNVRPDLAPKSKSMTSFSPSDHLQPSKSDAIEKARWEEATVHATTKMEGVIPTSSDSAHGTTHSVSPVVVSSGNSPAALDQEGESLRSGCHGVESADGCKDACVVCGESANGNFFGAVVCLPCKSFFIRCTKDGEPSIVQRCYGDCEIKKQLRNRCQFCRYKRCLDVGMSRKEKPESVHPSDGQELCKVCGDLANGVHFGVSTCEGCKKFFRRGLKEHTSYICKDNSDCLLNPRNRNNCRHCRYRKCLNVGMSREAIKMGRPRKLYPGRRTVEEHYHQAKSIFSDRTQRISPPLGSAMPVGHYGQSVGNMGLERANLANGRLDQMWMADPMVDSKQEVKLETPEHADRICYPEHSGSAFEDDRTRIMHQVADCEPVQNEYCALQRQQQFQNDPQCQRQSAMNNSNFIQKPEGKAFTPFEGMLEQNSFSPSSNCKKIYASPSTDNSGFCQSSRERSEMFHPKRSNPVQMEKMPPLIKAQFNNFPANDFQPSFFKLSRTLSSQIPTEVPRGHNHTQSTNAETYPDAYYKTVNEVSHIINDPSRTPQSVYSHDSESPSDNSCISLQKGSNMTESFVEMEQLSSHKEYQEALDLRVCPNSKGHGQHPNKETRKVGSAFSYRGATNTSWHSYSTELKSSTLKRKYDVIVDEDVNKNSKCMTFQNANCFQSDANAPSFKVCENEYQKMTKYSPRDEKWCHSNMGFQIPPENLGNLHSFDDQHEAFVPISVKVEHSSHVNSNFSSELHSDSKIPRFEKINTPDLYTSQTWAGHNRKNIQFSSGSEDCHIHQDVTPSLSHSKNLGGNISKIKSPPFVRSIEHDNSNNLYRHHSSHGPSRDEEMHNPNMLPKGSRMFDPYSNESTIKYVNEMFLVYDTLMSSGNQSPDTTNGRQPGNFQSNEISALDGMFTNAFSYSPVKVQEMWHQIYTPGASAARIPEDDADQTTLPDVQRDLMLDMMQDYEEKVLVCDENANRPAIDTNLVEAWPARGKDRDYWLHFQERIARQTYAETRFVHKIADRLRVNDKRLLEEKTKLLCNTILMASREWYDPVRKKFKFFWNWKLPQDHPLSPFHQRILRLGSRIFNLHMDRNEITLLSILNTLSSGTQGAQESPQVASKAKQVIQMLSHYLRSISVDPNDRIPELLDVMPRLYHMSVWYSNLIKNMKADPNSMDRTFNDLIKLASHFE